MQHKYIKPHLRHISLSLTIHLNNPLHPFLNDLQNQSTTSPNRSQCLFSQRSRVILTWSCPRSLQVSKPRQKFRTTIIQTVYPDQPLLKTSGQPHSKAQFKFVPKVNSIKHRTPGRHNRLSHWYRTHSALASIVVVDCSGGYTSSHDVYYFHVDFTPSDVIQYDSI
jgi:hypothetical protein